MPPERPGREWIKGFLLLGVLVGLLGSLLIAWQYHIHTEPEVIGFHFLACNLGLVIGVACSRRWLLRVPMRSIALLACFVGFAGLVALSFLGPPLAAGWRMGGLAVVGFGGGALGTTLLHVLEPWFTQKPSDALNTSGALFGAGCTIATVIVGATYFLGSIQIETGLLAVVPVVFFFIFLRSKLPWARQPFPRRLEQERHLAALKDIRSVAALLFSALLFFQSGNEFLIAGWLPLFLIHRLGANPVLAIMALALYFLSLTLGRVATRKWFLRFQRRRLLFGSGVVAMAGYVLLSWAPTMAWVWPATVLVGAGFAPIYPLLAEILDDRFSYHPGFYNGIFSVAVTGAMGIPWLVGYLEKELGGQYIMVVPALGSFAVTALVLLLMFEARLMGDTPESKGQELASKAAAAGQSE